MNDNSRYDVFFTSLSTLHDQVNSRHEESRQRVLAAIENEKPAVRRKQPHWRIAAGALSAAASLMLLVWLASPPSAAVAMEQLAEALEQVTEYAYEMESISVSSQADARTVRQVTKGRWRNEPVA